MFRHKRKNDCLTDENAMFPLNEEGAAHEIRRKRIRVGTIPNRLPAAILWPATAQNLPPPELDMHNYANTIQNALTNMFKEVSVIISPWIHY